LDIIPVIDILAGQVVQARFGQRETYAPWRSPLGADAKPATVIAGLLRLAPFRTIYLADLDALLGQWPQTDVIAQLVAAFPGVRFWLDQGLPARQSTLALHGDRVTPVLGSESLRDEQLDILRGAGHRVILSLDFHNQAIMGSGQLLQRPELWPERIILMNLSRVGSLAGPDVEGAGYFISHFPRHRFIAAGGVRNAQDLHRLATQGVAAVLVASALHNGALSEKVLSEWGGSCP